MTESHVEIISAASAARAILRANAEGRRVHLRIRPWVCPFCGDTSCRPSKRSSLVEKPLALFSWVRRCKTCGHRYYAPLFLCFRPSSFWSLVALAVAAVGAFAFLSYLRNFVPG